MCFLGIAKRGFLAARYTPAAGRTIVWNDPNIGLDWPVSKSCVLVSEKDERGATLREAEVFLTLRLGRRIGSAGRPDTNHLFGLQMHHKAAHSR